MGWWITHKWVDLLPWDRGLPLEVTCTPPAPRIPIPWTGDSSHYSQIAKPYFFYVQESCLLTREDTAIVCLTAPYHIRVTVYILVTGKTRTPGLFTAPCSRLAAGLHSPEGAMCDGHDLHVKEGQESWCGQNLMAHLVLTSDTTLSTLGFTRITVSRVSLRWWRVLWPEERKGIRQDERSWWDSIQLLMF